MSIFNLPDLGEGLPDAEIVRWLVKEGDTLTIDQPMVEMETAKAVVEVPSPIAGKITKFYGGPGDVIQTGSPLAEFDGAGNSAAPQSANQSKAEPTASNAIPAAQTTANEDFKLPDLGEGLPDAEIVRWLVKEGETVTVDQPMVEMETAKAVVEVPSPLAGTIAKLHGNAGDVIAVGAVLVSFGVAGTTQSAAACQSSESTSEEDRADSGTVVGSVQVGNTVVAESASAVVKALAKKLKVDLSQVSGSGANGAITQADVKAAAKTGRATASATSVAIVPSAGTQTNNPLAYRASPAVRALARKLNIDLGQCQASGKKGTITRDDVNAAASGTIKTTSRAAAIDSTAASTSASSSPRLPTVSVSREPQAIRGVRRAMAQGMAHSHATVVPTTLVEDVNISRWKKGTDSLARYIRAMVYACRVEPALNAWFDGENMERLLHPNVNIGIAIDTPDGLYVPVVHNVDQMNMVESRAAVQVLRDKVSNKGIKPADLANATVTLSNFGSIAGRYGTPVVSPPQVAILGTGRFRNELQLTDKGIENQRMLPLSLTFDHRACTGGEAARFLAAIMEDLAKAE